MWIHHTTPTTPISESRRGRLSASPPLRMRVGLIRVEKPIDLQRTYIHTYRAITIQYNTHLLQQYITY